MSNSTDMNQLPETRDHSAELAESVISAYNNKQPLRIYGGNSKSFYGRPVNTEQTLDITGHRGVMEYEPSELAITVRAGTPLAEVEALLDANGQQFPFEPPHFGANSTIGGTIATGLSGPCRPYSGSVRDSVLGVKIINGRGEILKFGGNVMKNVAGYDISRFMVGSLGILGVILEVSIKVMPKSKANLTLINQMTLPQSLQQIRQWSKRSLPITATCWLNDTLYVRISGSEGVLKETQPITGGDPLAKADEFWNQLRDHKLSFFENTDPLWRLSVPPAAELPDLPGEQLVEWGGALRWLNSKAPESEIRSVARSVDGNCTFFNSRHESSGDREVFDTLPRPVMQLHQRLKQAFDPAGIFNPGRMYSEI